ncbi:hypothetical protein [Herbaspirillum sp. NPDC087042]|uniref:hypothetical protein n=1 Tax=Herbaspirillum sp. NPDC087042 TaxID=3364004 RepID=UPI00380DF144
MYKTLLAVALLGATTLAQVNWDHALLAANAGALDISVIVAEKCRVDFSEGSADFFQVCSVGQGVANERASQVMGSATALAPQDDPYYLERDPDQPAQPATAQGNATLVAARKRQGPNVVVIHY